MIYSFKKVKFGGLRSFSSLMLVKAFRDQTSICSPSGSRIMDRICDVFKTVALAFDQAISKVDLNDVETHDGRYPLFENYAAI